MKNKKKNITLNDLAIMVAKGFEGVDKRFEKLEERMNGKKATNERREEGDN